MYVGMFTVESIYLFFLPASNLSLSLQKVNPSVSVAWNWRFEVSTTIFLLEKGLVEKDGVKQKFLSVCVCGIVDGEDLCERKPI